MDKNSSKKIILGYCNCANWSYDVLCDSYSSEDEEEYKYELTVNCIVNQKKLVTKIETFLACNSCPQEN